MSSVSLVKMKIKRGDGSKRGVSESKKIHLPIRCKCQSASQRGQRGLFPTQSCMQQLWYQWLHSPQTTAQHKREETSKVVTASRQDVQCPINRTNTGIRLSLLLAAEARIYKKRLNLNKLKKVYDN